MRGKIQIIISDSKLGQKYLDIQINQISSHIPKYIANQLFNIGYINDTLIYNSESKYKEKLTI